MVQEEPGAEEPPLEVESEPEEGRPTDSESDSLDELSLDAQADVPSTIGNAPYTYARKVLTVGAGEFVLDDWNAVAKDAIGTSGIEGIVFTGGAKMTGDASSMCAGMGSLAEVDARGLDVSGVTSMQGMFQNDHALTSVDLSGWDVGAVASMNSMFLSCDKLATIRGLLDWNTSSLQDMGSMFASCFSLTSIDLSTWDVSRVQTMSKVFNGCPNLESVDLSGWNTSAVTNMERMFFPCSSLQTIVVGPGWTTSAVVSSESMFKDCTALVGGAGTTYDAAQTDWYREKTRTSCLARCCMALVATKRARMPEHTRSLHPASRPRTTRLPTRRGCSR